MPRDYPLYLEDMLEAIARVERYTSGVDFAAFSADKMRVDAVVRNLELIGEAAKNIPQARRDLTPQRLLVEARQRGAPVEAVAEKLLTEQLADVHLSERDRATAVLRAAGLLTELSPEEKERAARSTLTLEEARAILDRAGGKPLSEVILEMRGPKE